MTSVSYVENFISQKVFFSVSAVTVTISNAFRFVSVAEFLCKQVEFLLKSFDNKNFKCSNSLCF